MEPAGFKSKGSFGIPEGLKKELEEARKNPPPPAGLQHPKAQQPVAAMQPPFEAMPVPPESAGTAEEAQPLAKEPEDPTKALGDLKVKLEESLGATLDEKDVQDYVFRGRLTKEVNIIPGVLRGTFQTLTPVEVMEIDVHMAEFRDKGKFTADGIVNEQTIVTLSYCWLAAAGKPLIAGNEPKKREEKIRKMGVITIDSASRAFNELNLMLRVLFGERQHLKKS